jgi:hypothetical protein
MDRPVMRRTRRFDQYNPVRWILLSMMLASVVAAALHGPLMQGRARERAIAATLRGVGGDVHFAAADLPWPLSWLGDGYASYYERIDAVDLSCCPATDDDLAILCGLRSLRTLRLRYTPIGDDGLRHVAGIASLEEVSLDGTRVTDTGLEVLRSLARLKSVSLYATAVTKAGAATLASHGVEVAGDVR